MVSFAGARGSIRALAKRQSYSCCTRIPSSKREAKLLPGAFSRGFRALFGALAGADTARGQCGVLMWVSQIQHALHPLLRHESWVSILSMSAWPHLYAVYIGMLLRQDGNNCPWDTGIGCWKGFRGLWMKKQM